MINSFKKSVWSKYIFIFVVFANFYFVPSSPSAIRRIIVAVVVVDHAEFCIVVLTAPLDGLLHITCRGYLPVGRVGIGGADVA